VNHRHLLPDEIDQLLDEELGFGAAPLKAHVADCEACRARLDDARAVTALVEDLPHLAPSYRFSERVMGEVQPFVPWHVAARDAMSELIPAAGRSRTVAVVAGTAVAAMLALVTILLATQIDLLAFTVNVAVDRMREIVVAAVGGLIVSLFGAQTFDAVARHGVVGFALAAGALLLGLGAAFASLRGLAASASRRRG
jgi:hypothetical protein